MFKCKKCNSIDDFVLMFHPNYKGNKDYSRFFDNNGVLTIIVDGYKFTPDINFMNTHAVCRYCGEIESFVVE